VGGTGGKRQIAAVVAQPKKDRRIFRRSACNASPGAVTDGHAANDNVKQRRTTMTASTIRRPEEYLNNGTRVLNTEDGEPGWIVNGFSHDPANGGWVEYEVETRYGIERWKRTDFVLMSEIESE
jgi:hypothetical protein